MKENGGSPTFLAGKKSASKNGYIVQFTSRTLRQNCERNKPTEDSGACQLKFSDRKSMHLESREDSFGNNRGDVEKGNHECPCNRNESKLSSSTFILFFPNEHGLYSFSKSARKPCLGNENRAVLCGY